MNTPNIPPAANENFASNAPSAERDKTRGEHLFNWSVYAGIGWIVNAAISLVALDWFEYNKTGQKAAEFGKSAIGTLLKPLKLSAARHSKFTNMGFFIAALYTGGTLLIPVMKWFEDRKGSLVRFADRVLHGKEEAETNQKLIEAHAEMDEAPKQSWGSMLKARILSLPAGIGIGLLVGNHDAFSSKIAANSGFSKYSSFERAGATIGRGFYQKRPPNIAANDVWNEVRDLARNAGVAAPGKNVSTWESALNFARRESPHTTQVGLDPRRVRFASNTLYELLLSSFVAAGFFVTSHAFARLRDNRQQRRDERADLKQFPVVATLPKAANDREPIANDNDHPQERPTARVAQVERAPMQEALQQAAAL